MDETESGNSYDRVLFLYNGEPVTRQYITALHRKANKVKVYKSVIRSQQKAIDDRNRRIENLEAKVVDLVNRAQWYDHDSQPEDVLPTREDLAPIGFKDDLGDLPTRSDLEL